MTARFYAEDLGISLEHAERVARFMSIATASKACINPTPWAKHGQVRVYFDVWSQNNLPAVEALEAAYFDASKNGVFIQQQIYGRRQVRDLKEIVRGKKAIFSGAKTKAALIDMAGAFYGQKASWG